MVKMCLLVLFSWSTVRPKQQPCDRVRCRLSEAGSPAVQVVGRSILTLTRTATCARLRAFQWRSGRSTIPLRYESSFLALCETELQSDSPRPIDLVFSHGG